MNIRWHEIGLFQRINTVLLIEGRCGKPVRVELFIITELTYNFSHN